MKKILVTGASGQLGTCIQHQVKKEGLNLEFVFMDSAMLDVTKKESVLEHFLTRQYDYCINCAAYTRVDDAEIEREKAYLINEEGPKNLAMACHETNSVLLHISTDFVFDGTSATPYLETNQANPLGYYGISKHMGEQQVIAQMSRYFIIRTSWLYSEYGQNFMKSMIRHGRTKNTLSVVYDQVGTPTYAIDLVKVLLKIIISDSQAFGTYHFSNEGVASWYDFTKAIFEINQIKADLKPIRTEEYPLPAARPAYSVMDKDKIKRAFQISIPYWRDSLVLASHALMKLEDKTIKLIR